MKNGKNIIIGILFLAIIICVYIIYSRSSINHSELFALKEDCAVKAKEFVEKNTSTSISADVRWNILYSDYIVSRKSCFAEFQKSIFITNMGENSEYLYIYDLLTGQIMALLKLTNNENWKDEAPAAYQKVRKQILGLEIN